ncbi:chemotaxis protein MotB [Ruegeria pomeroyi]|uniref:Chemotaxis protein MotB n=1 Tax=Ruegeria pomeroyi TaxID=89184 RepID=A0A9Q3WPQ2_9RHOB|nr:flagellar motor protein MotB [Ruegeria pomeroyi]MCE8517706.1 chemotaxis protein MotB [Ruegeria pomeroyi]MCE8526953.1 chemotaxis protein MotB [Ruegeria pomeroyi]MCE8539838.1 chemotaxis protein MotB [Ruegeria pomeroyi]MCE8552988.1 chemotaxis protein MotB [Ruegeria pomeroyi]
MGAHSNAAPIIIKKKKSGGGDGHHGGAWKVAYADFVTAMMAFFMLMWLLNATTEKQRKGLADYFSDSIPINPVSGGGDGSFGGDSMFSENAMVTTGTGGVNRRRADANRSRGSTGVDRQGGEGQPLEEFKTLEAALQGRGGESLVSEQLRKHIVTRVTDEGLIVELISTDESPLFETGTDRPTQLMKDLAKVVVRASELVSNGIALGGHIRAHPVVLARNPAWELSTARAERTRVLFEGLGMKEERIQRVTGYADRKLTDKNPMAARNDRIEVVFLRS